MLPLRLGFLCLIASLYGGAAAWAQPAMPVPLPPANPTLSPSPRLAPPALPDLALDKQAFRFIARAEAEKAKVPFDLVDAVMKIESDYNPTRTGELDEIGLMQVRPGTAAMLGFKGDEGSLLTPAINIHYGTVYLGEAWRLAGGNVCRALMKYRAGHGNESMSALSAAYCARARTHLASIGSPLAAGIGEVELVALPPDSTPSIREPSGRPKSGASFWSAFRARIQRINTRIEAKWRRAAIR